MATRVGSLVRASLNVNFGVSAARYYYLKKRQRLWEPALIGFALATLGVTVGGGVAYLANVLYSQLAPVNQQGVVLTMAILVAQLLVLVLGIVFVMSTFYFSSDLPILVPLPYAAWEVMASKFAVLLVNEYVTTALVLVPTFAVYGLRSHGGLAYAASAAVTFLAIPVLPLVIASALTVILMRLTNLSKRRDMLIIVGSLLLIGAIMGLQFFIQSNAARGNEQEFLLRLLSTADGLVRLVGTRFPPSIWATRALAEAGAWPGLANLLLLVAVSAGGFAALVGLGELVFYRGLVGGFEAPGTRRRLAGAAARQALEASYARLKRRHPVLSLALVDIRLLLRTPIFLLNCCVGFVLFPVLLAMPAAIQDKELAPLVNFIRTSPLARSVGVLVVAGYFIVSTAFSAIPATPFSREGRPIWVTRTLPLPAALLLRGKWLAATAVVGIGSLPGVAVLAYVARLPLPNALAGIALGALAAFALSGWGVALDWKRPLTNWTDPQRAIKTNLNTIFVMVAVIVLAAALGFACYFAFKAGVSVATIAGMLLLIFAGLAAGAARVHAGFG